MTCIGKDKNGAEILLDYCDGKPNAELDQHLEACSECRGLVEAQRTVYSALEQWHAPEVSSNFDAALYKRIAEDRPSLWQRIWKPAVPIAVAAAALSLALVIKQPEPIHAPAQTVVEKTDIDQVEQALDDIDMLSPPAM
jgi:anti-sigma factor RsiW